MEEIEFQRTRQWAKFLTLIVALVVMAAVLGTLIGVMLSYAKDSTGAVRSWLMRSAIVCVAMLGLTLIVLVCVIMRFALRRIELPTGRTRTEHVDAWALAGKRFRLPDEDEDEDEEPDSQEEDAPGGP